MNIKKDSKKTNTQAGLTPGLTAREKTALVRLRKAGVSAYLVGLAFGVSARSVATYAGNATRGVGTFSFA